MHTMSKNMYDLVITNNPVFKLFVQPINVSDLLRHSSIALAVKR